MSKLLTFESISNYVKQKSNGECEVVNIDLNLSNPIVILKCHCGNIFESDYIKLTDRKYIRCNNCVKKEARKRYSLSFNDVISKIKDCGCEYISGTYENNKSKLLLKCSCGNTFTKSLSHLMRGQNCCNRCVVNKLSVNKTKYTLDKAREILGKYGITILNENEYKNSMSTIKCKCSKGHIFNTKLSYHLNKQNPFICEKCACIAHSKSGNYNYNDGISELNDYCRRFLKEWKKSVIEKYNGKCYLTNTNKDINVHHLVGLDIIVKNCCKELNIPIKSSIKEYNEFELNNIGNLVKQKHSTDMGIVLQRKVHNKFHAIYGKKNNTIEQFNDFVKKYYPQSKLIPTLSS